MRGRLLDTTPEVEARYREMLLARSPSDHVVMACGMLDAARAIMLASLPADCDDVSRRVYLFTRTYGRDFDRTTARKIVARLRQSRDPAG